VKKSYLKYEIGTFDLRFLGFKNYLKTKKKQKFGLFEIFRF